MPGNFDGIDCGLFPLWTVAAFVHGNGEAPVGTASARDLSMAAGLVCSYLPVPQADFAGYYLIATRADSYKDRFTNSASAPQWRSTPLHEADGWAAGPWSVLESPRAAGD
ncbi:hypothetical protein [Nocardia goodfellowii]|uniref:Uncharacterized protein n=1 Tax=Nocardia goodfellowii TaxID=882446 RepID=A0ABS4Q6F4_9NOCA|nr:hypothetical protein [Nocardia goodfellowii]MBP2187275.1 hypothetical protein [Nocardia goodfellowii]